MAGSMKRTIVRYSVVAVVLAGGTFLVASQAAEEPVFGPTVLGAPADPTPSPYHRVEERVSVPDDPAPFVAPEPPVVADPAPSGQGVQLAPTPGVPEPVVVETTPAPSTEPVTSVGTEPVVVERPRDGGIRHPAPKPPVVDEPSPTPSPMVPVDPTPEPVPGVPGDPSPDPSPEPSMPSEDDAPVDDECVF